MLDLVVHTNGAGFGGSGIEGKVALTVMLSMTLAPTGAQGIKMSVCASGTLCSE